MYIIGSIKTKEENGDYIVFWTSTKDDRHYFNEFSSKDKSEMMKVFNKLLDTQTKEQ